MLIYSPLSQADDISGDSWQSVTAVHYESDGLTLCD
jgi:hypothetical protein